MSENQNCNNTSCNCKEPHSNYIEVITDPPYTPPGYTITASDSDFWNSVESELKIVSETPTQDALDECINVLNSVENEDIVRILKTLCVWFELGFISGSNIVFEEY